MDVAADKVLQGVIAVHTAAPLADLGNPRPDMVGRAPDADGASRSQVNLVAEFIARQRGTLFVLGCTPGELPSTTRHEVQRRESTNRDHSPCIPARHPAQAPSSAVIPVVLFPKLIGRLNRNYWAGRVPVPNEAS
jgi:hypothetical protein